MPLFNKLLPVRHLIMHIGPPKTGTTSIQHALHNSRDELLANGIYIPLTTRYPGQHRSIIHEFMGARQYAHEYPGDSGVISLRDVRRDMTDLGLETLLISSEDWSSQSRGEHVGRLIRKINPDRLTIIMTVRPPVKWMVSSFMESSKLFFLRPTRAQNFGQRITTHIARIWGPEALTVRLETWMKLVNNSELRILVMDKSRDLLADFTSAAELPIGFGPQQRVNERSDICRASASRALRSYLDEQGVPRDELREMLEGLWQQFDTDEPAPPHECSCRDTVTPKQRERIQTAFADFVTRLESLRPQVWGNIRDLVARPETADEYVPSNPNPDSFNLAIRLVMTSVRNLSNLFFEMRDGTEFWMKAAQAREAEGAYWREQAEATQAELANLRSQDLRQK